MRIIATVALAAIVPLAGCATAEPSAPTIEESVVSGSAAVPVEQELSPEDELRNAAESMNTAFANRDAEGAWEFYSQRCKVVMGEDVEIFRSMMEFHYEGRSPAVESLTVRVNGSSGQVVTLDNDPAAPADSMQPRTWTYIDGRWQFDNC